MLLSLKHTFSSVLMWQKHTSKCCQICHPWMGSRGSCTMNCTNLLADLIVSRVGLAFHNSNLPRGVLVRICKHYIYCQRILDTQVFKCKEASWALSIWESHDVPKCWVGSYPLSGGYPRCWVRKNLLRLWF